MNASLDVLKQILQKDAGAVFETWFKKNQFQISSTMIYRYRIFPLLLENRAWECIGVYWNLTHPISEERMKSVLNTWVLSKKDERDINALKTWQEKGIHLLDIYYQKYEHLPQILLPLIINKLNPIAPSFDIYLSVVSLLAKRGLVWDKACQQNYDIIQKKWPLVEKEDSSLSFESATLKNLKILIQKWNLEGVLQSGVDFSRQTPRL